MDFFIIFFMSYLPNIYLSRWAVFAYTAGVYCFLFIFIGVAGLLQASSTICLNMIVKDETNVIRRCLESVKPLIDTWVIVDTGSTDGTQELVKEILKDIPGVLHERPWVDFGHNRNEALAYAREKADYILFIDADDKLTLDPMFVKPELRDDFYNFKILNSAGITYARAGLVKSSLDWKWVGVVHEVITSGKAKSSSMLEGVTLHYLGEEIDPRMVQNFLGMRFFWRGLFKEIRTMAGMCFIWPRATEMPVCCRRRSRSIKDGLQWGDGERKRFGRCIKSELFEETLGAGEDVINRSYMEAYKYRPSRAEPLYRLSSYYRLKKNYLLGYLLSRMGLSIERPADVLFVEGWVYDYGLLLEYSICTYWLGKYEESCKACQELLAKRDLPKDVRERTKKILRLQRRSYLNEDYFCRFAVLLGVACGADGLLEHDCEK